MHGMHSSGGWGGDIRVVYARDMTRFTPTRKRTTWLEFKESRKESNSLAKWLPFISFQIEWLNNYHKQCREKTGKMLKDQKKTDVYNWLVELTEPVSQKGPIPTGGTGSLAVSAVIMLFAAVGLFLHMWDTSYLWLLLELWLSATEADVIFKAGFH